MLFIPHKHLYINGTSYVSADEPDYKEVITDANSRRRMGRLLKMAVWCGLKSLDGVPSERVAGIITSTGAGFMKDTISFGSSIFDREETLLNPSPFMQSTFNTASGYIALIRKIHAYNTTYVQQADGFAASLVDAAMLLDDAGDGNVALVGAFDEVTPEVDVIRQRLGLYRVGDGFLPLGEGAAAFLLSAAMPTDGSETSSLPLNESGLASSNSLNGTKDGNAALRFCGLANLSDLPKRAENPIAELFGINAGVNVISCTDHVESLGAFRSLLPVLLCKLISEQKIPDGYTAIVDDVNEDGVIILLHK